MQERRLRVIGALNNMHKWISIQNSFSTPTGWGSNYQHSDSFVWIVQFAGLLEWAGDMEISNDRTSSSGVEVKQTQKTRPEIRTVCLFDEYDSWIPHRSPSLTNRLALRQLHMGLSKYINQNLPSSCPSSIPCLAPWSCSPSPVPAASRSCRGVRGCDPQSWTARNRKEGTNY